MIKSNLTKFERVVFLIALVAHLLAAYTSFGYHHSDEHYQVWEWANYFLGLSKSRVNLPWEYSAEIRPWFQAFLHIVGMKVALLLNLFNPFSFAFIARALYGVANWIGLVYLWKVWKEKEGLSPYWSFFIATLWFFPYIHVRTSSENLAGIFLTFAFAYFLKSPETKSEGRKYFGTGILFGFSFLARYQIALGLVGLAGYLLYRDRKILKEHLLLFLGFLCPLLFGLLLDRIGYGNWVFTPYRYFSVNLVEGVAATYNPYPSYQYLIWILELNPLVSLPLFLGLVLYTVRKRIDAISAFIWSFFLLHCLISNKEYRFLFPILNLVPFLAVSGIALAWPRFLATAQKKKFWIPYVIMTLLAFAASSLRGAAINTLWVPQAVHDHFDPNGMVLSQEDYVLNPQTSYYALPPHLEQTLHSAADLEAGLKQYAHVKVILDGSLNDQLTQDLWSIAQQHSCKVIASGYPYFIYSFRNALPFLRNARLYVMYECGN